MTSKRIQKIVKSLDKKVRKLLKPDHFYVVLYDTVKSELVFLRLLSEKEVLDEKTRSYQPQRLPDQIIEKKKHWLVEENIDEKFEAAGVVYGPGDQQPRSWLGMPMIFEGRVLGALVVESRVSRAFGKRGVRVLTTMARQTASAIENSRLYERMESINEIGQKLNSQIQLKESEILTLIHKEASKLIYADNMYIALYDEAQNEIIFPLIYIDGEKKEVDPRKLDRVEMGKTEYIILERDTLFHATRAESQAWYDQPGHADHIDNPLASWIGVPMVVHDKVIGVIAAYHEDQDYIYDQHDLLILESMASQAAIALDNANVYNHLDDLVFKRTKQLEERTKQLETLYDISVKITSQLELEGVLESIAEHTNNLMEAGFTTLFTFDAEQNEFKQGVRSGEVKEEPTMPTQDSYVYRIAKDQSPIFYSGRDVFRKYPSVPVDNRESVSFAGIPLIARGKTVGVLLVNYFDVRIFSEQDKEILELLANQAAIALDNASVYNHLDELVSERTRELEDANKEIAHKEAVLVRAMISADFVHRLNNLAGTIPIWADFIEEEVDKISCNKKSKESIIRNLSKIHQDTDDLLRAAEQLGDQPEEQQVDVKFILGSMIRQTKIQHHGSVTVVDDINSNLYKVKAISFNLIGALSSIIENGVEAIKEQGEGTLKVIASNSTVDKRSPQIAIDILDSGGGISPENKEKIFFPYFSTKEPGKRGYGLWRSKSIINNLGGTIEVISPLEDNSIFNTRFRVTLPAILESE